MALRLRTKTPVVSRQAARKKQKKFFYIFAYLTCANRLSQIAYRLSQIAYRLSQIAYRLSQIAYRLSQIAYRLSQIAYRLSQIAIGNLRFAICD